VSYVCYTCYYDMIHMTHNMLSRIYLKDHSSFCLSSVHWAISSAIRNSLKSRKLFPSESNIRKMWSQKLSALPEGKIFVNSSEDWKQLTFFQITFEKNMFLPYKWVLESLPFGHSVRKLLNQNKIVFLLNLVFLRQNCKSLSLNFSPVGAQFL